MEKADFALIGDSHAGAIGKAARAAGLAFAGGPLASAREFYTPFWRGVDTGLAFTNPETEEMHGELCRLLGVANMADIRVPVVSTIGSGFHVPATRALWTTFEVGPDIYDADFLDNDLFAGICARMLAPMLDFHRALLDRGIAVQFALPPQRLPDTASEPILQVMQAQAIAALARAGCSIVDVRDACAGPDGWLAPEFCQEGDPLHANTAYGQAVLRAAGWL